jgi:hypothetical protein
MWPISSCTRVRKAFKQKAYLQLGPLYATDASHGIAPGQLCAKHELRLGQLVRAVQVDLLLHVLPAGRMRRAVQPATQLCGVLRFVVAYFTTLSVYTAPNIRMTNE